MKHAKNRFLALTSALALAALVGCDGSSKTGEFGNDAQPTLLAVETGRLVDVYSFRRVDPDNGDRRQRTNRRIELVASNVLINANVEAQSLFDAAGQPASNANYEFMPFDKAIGHEELVILWDDRPGPEEQNFQTALAAAQVGLGQVPPSYRGQNTQTRPIPIVPRNAAIRLTFSGNVETDASFFTVNPSVIQLLEFKGDPEVVEPVDAFRILPYRIIAKGNTLILDTTILGGEAAGAATTPGLPPSADNQTANIRIAIPSRGGAVSTFYVKEDSVEQLNGDDSAGRNSVIRDFRSGNLIDGTAGRMREPEAPMIVSPLAMGITAVDTVNNVITLNKRSQLVPVRGRYPFVDGPLGLNGIPRGPSSSPVQRPLKFGDILQQSIQVEVQPGQFETVTLRAEVLENLAIFSTVGDPAIGLVDPASGPAGSDTGQGETVGTVQVRVASVFAGADSTGTPRAFRANGQPQGQDCTLRARYYEENLFTGSASVLTDRTWRNYYVRIDPKPTGASTLPVTDVQPNASVAVEFTKPMDVDQVDPTFNLLLTSQPPGAAAETFAQQMTDPKAATSRVVTARLTDLAGDGTVLRLQPPLGLFHVQGANPPESYRINVRLGATGVTDLAGTPLEVFENPANPQDSWTVAFSVASAALTNRIGWHSYNFEAEDEDGTQLGSADFFGQYRLENGRLTAANTVRFGRSADRQNLQTITRILRGECWEGRDQVPNPGPPPGPPTPGNIVIVPGPTGPFPFRVPRDSNGTPHAGNLYWDPQMSATILPPVPIVYEFWQTVAQPVGRVIEPMKPQGSRMQMRYLEDDFSLSYRQPSEFALDVEQLYWSPFNDEAVQYDVFDRFTMSLAHSRRRPDEYWFLTPASECQMNCASMNSALSEVFGDNVLEGTSLQPVFEDTLYAINPNEAFRTIDGYKYVPFPRFDRTYTWRDSRLVSIDASGNVIGLGGAQEPRAAIPLNDWTAKIDSPWITSRPAEQPWPLPFVADPDFFGLGNTTYCEDPADFRGEAQRDHDPIALPLLVDFKMFADDQANGLAIGTNGFQVAMLGPPSFGGPPFGGYYDNFPAGCAAAQPRWPRVRVHASGGFDLITLQEVRVDPANVLSSQGSVVKDAGLGSAQTALFLAPSGDGMLNWARADFVRKVSMVTFGFVDTLRPQFAVLPTAGNGFPDLVALGSTLRASDLVVQMDPPQARQPAGTSVVVEIRGADSFANDSVLYDQAANDLVNVEVPANGRGNLLNTNYACEAYRYSTPNAGATFDVARVVAVGLTRYVTEDQLAQIRNPATQLLPRFLNVRIVMTNNVDVSPALSPSLRSLGIVYRVQ